MTLMRSFAAALAIVAVSSASAIAQQPTPHVFTLDAEQAVVLHHALDMAERHLAARRMASPAGEDAFMIALGARELFRLKQVIATQEQETAKRAADAAAKKDAPADEPKN